MYLAPVQGAYSPQGTVLISIETSCHFGHLLLVSNDRRQQAIVSEKKSIVLPFPIQKHKGSNLTLP